METKPKLNLKIWRWVYVLYPGVNTPVKQNEFKSTNNDIYQIKVNVPLMWKLIS